MSFWNKLFGKKDSREEIKSESPFMPEKKDPVEISFAHNFIKRGGRFLFSESDSDYKNYFNKILDENQWKKSDIFTLDNNIAKDFNVDDNSDLSILKNKKAVFINCEFLIANTGGILISSNQIKNLKLVQLPENIIVKAQTNQFVRDVSDGMSKLKAFYSKNLPVNITTLNAKSIEKETDFLFYGNNSKNIYLLLQ